METPFKLHQIETLLFFHLNRSGLAVPDAVLAFLLWLDLLIDMVFVLMAHKSYIYIQHVKCIQSDITSNPSLAHPHALSYTLHS
jgi:hypothetical protein